MSEAEDAPVEVESGRALHRENVAEPVYQELRAAIRAWRYSADHVFLETAVSSRFEVSRTSARIVLLRLYDEGLLVRASRGFRLRTHTADDIIELYDARILLEERITALAAERRTEFDIARLEFMIEREEAVRGDLVGVRAVQMQWHQSLGASAHHRVLWTLLERVDAQAQLFVHPSLGGQDTLAANFDDHVRITRAIRERDEIAAREGIVAHLVRARDERIRLLARSTDVGVPASPSREQGARDVE